MEKGADETPRTAGFTSFVVLAEDNGIRRESPDNP